MLLFLQLEEMIVPENPDQIAEHVCPWCHDKFVAPVWLADTLCPECFAEGYNTDYQPPSTPWRGTLAAGIICLAGAFGTALWIAAR